MPHQQLELIMVNDTFCSATIFEMAERPKLGYRSRGQGLRAAFQVLTSAGAEPRWLAMQGLQTPEKQLRLRI